MLWAGALALVLVTGGCGRAGFRDPPTTDSLRVKLHWGHVVYLGLDDTLYGWGLNENGQLGSGEDSSESVWTPTAFEERFRRAEVTRYATFLFDEDNALWELGSSGLSLVSTIQWQTVAGGGDHRCGIATDGTMWCWGRNDFGELGLGHNDTVPVPTQVESADDWIYLASAGSMVCGIRSPGYLWCWGDNQNRQLGVGDNVNRNIPTQVGTDDNWLQVAGGTHHTCAVKKDGTLWCWGAGSNARTGLGEDGGSKSTPQQVLAEDDPDAEIAWLQVATGFEHSCGRRADGSLWCWGNTEDGRLGLPDLGGAASVLSPRRLQPDSEWIEVQAGGGSGCALDSGLQLWCWGTNGKGELGIGEGMPDSDVPTPVTIP